MPGGVAGAYSLIMGSFCRSRKKSLSVSESFSHLVLGPLLALSTKVRPPDLRAPRRGSCMTITYSFSWEPARVCFSKLFCQAPPASTALAGMEDQPAGGMVHAAPEASEQAQCSSRPSRRLQLASRSVSVHTNATTALRSDPFCATQPVMARPALMSVVVYEVVETSSSPSSGMPSAALTWITPTASNFSCRSLGKEARLTLPACCSLKVVPCTSTLAPYLGLKPTADLLIALARSLLCSSSLALGFATAVRFCI
mmetsp:Transcript_16099/g.34833  ORF Transcript_16099/g.34833 Transcript_16099/m.34833 type:complete len:255 (-) Transcript_16099:257-1021(-)